MSSKGGRHPHQSGCLVEASWNLADVSFVDAWITRILKIRLVQQLMPIHQESKVGLRASEY